MLENIAISFRQILLRLYSANILFIKYEKTNNELMRNGKVDSIALLITEVILILCIE